MKISEKNNSEKNKESVWSYPRPPKLEPTGRRIRVVQGGRVIAETQEALRILETSHPPVYYLPPQAIAQGTLQRSDSRGSFCEFKGVAAYWDLATDEGVVKDVGWSYARPAAGYEALADHVAFYASRVDECWVDEERVVAQAGDFYGGWITSDLIGPFKGAPGTRGW